MAKPAPTVLLHGSKHLPAVDVEAYNAELRDEEGFVGDRATRRAFQAIIEDWRALLRGAGDDPFGDVNSERIGKRKFEKALASGDVAAAGVVFSAIEEFAQELSVVCRRLLRLKAWQGVERIAVGGGFRGGRVGEVAISRAALLLRAAGHPVDLRPIRHHPDEAGLIGAAHFLLQWMLAGHDAILSVDIGGTNIRAGMIDLGSHKDLVLRDARVVRSAIWRHADASPTRDEAVRKLAGMLRRLIRLGERKGSRFAPFIGIGCPGVIGEDGSIERGGQNLPGNWESSRFNLPNEIRALLPAIADQPTVVLLHNDAVAQGLSELPRMQDVERWGIVTIGTGLGNACFSSRRSD